jgi:hypothetical protein
MIFFATVSARYWRLKVVSTVQPILGVWYVGETLAMQRGLYGGHSPITLSRTTVVRATKSEGGQFLGRYIVRAGVRTSAQWSNLTASWYRENFDPFVEAAREYPFFFAWRPSQYPEEIGFCWMDGDVAPRNQGQRNYMSVGIDMDGAGSYEVTERAATPGLPVDEIDGFSDQMDASVIPYSGEYSAIVLAAGDDVADSGTLAAIPDSGTYTQVVISAGDDVADSGTLAATPNSGTYVDVTQGAGDDITDSGTISAAPQGGTYTEVVV